MINKSIMSRRSIRKYSDEVVGRESIENILRAGMQAPSTKNCQCWRFLVITDEIQKKRMSELHEFAVCIAKAPVVIVPIACFDKTEKDDLWWVLNMSAAVENMLIQIEEEGLGGIWIGVYPDEERVIQLKQILGITGEEVPFAAIPIGHKYAKKPIDDRWNPDKITWL